MEELKKFVLVKYPGKNIVLHVTGGYTTEKEREIIRSAGWNFDDNSLPRLTDEQLRESPYLVTESFHAPKGSKIFGLHKSSEEKYWKDALKEKFTAAGMKLYKRKGDLKELV